MQRQAVFARIPREENLATQLRRLNYVRDESFGVSEFSEIDNPTQLSGTTHQL
jgi:hypothetical protein